MKELKDSVFANTKRQPLILHLKLVAKVAKELFKSLNVDLPNNQNTEKTIFFAALFHDLGKLDPEYQKWCLKKLNPEEEVFEDSLNSTKFQDLVRHNELSWVLLNTIDLKNNFLSGQIRKDIAYIVLWHHAEKQRTSPLKNLEDIKNKVRDFQSIQNDASELIKQMSEFVLKETKETITPQIKDDVDNVVLPLYKEVQNRNGVKEYSTEINYLRSLCRLCVVSADREVSSMNLEEFNQYFVDCEVNESKVQELIKLAYNSQDNDLLQNSISSMLNKFPKSERNQKQHEAANQASKRTLSVLQGPAGVGKTKTALEYCLLNKTKKIFFIAPRVAVCEGLYKELRTQYLPEVKITICTGSNKRQSYQGKEVDFETPSFEGDIVVTTIDQLMGLMTNHGKLTLLLDLMNADLIFDEFHELMSVPSMVFYFKEILKIRECTQAKTLLMSATPNPVLLDFLEVDASQIVQMHSFHDKKIKMKLVQSNDIENLESVQVPRSLVISNLIETAQKGYLKDLRDPSIYSLVLHSGYTTEDKDKLFKLLFDNFGKTPHKTDLSWLRAGPIVQASLDISARQVFTESSSPEDLLQRLGRNNRFAEFEDSEFFIFYDNELKPSKYLTKGIFAAKTAKLFLDFLKNEKGSSFETSLDEIYSLYNKFYKENLNNENVLEDFSKYIMTGIGNLESNDYYKPMEWFRSNKKKELKLAAKSMRGSSIYINPSRLILRGNEVEVLGYMYDPSLIEEGSVDKGKYLTMGTDDYRLIQIMEIFRPKVKHVYAEFNKYNAKNNSLIFSKAREPQYGVYLSGSPGKYPLDYEENYGYYFELDRKTGRYKGLGLIKEEIFKEFGLNLITKEEK